jgi:hypothetical protein
MSLTSAPKALTQVQIDRQAMHDLVNYYQMVYSGYAHSWCNKMNYAMCKGWWKLLSDLALRVNAVDHLIDQAAKLLELLSNKDMTEKELNKLENQASVMFNDMTKAIMKHWQESKEEEFIDAAIEEDGKEDFAERQKELRKLIEKERGDPLDMSKLKEALPDEKKYPELPAHRQDIIM